MKINNEKHVHELLLQESLKKMDSVVRKDDNMKNLRGRVMGLATMMYKVMDLTAHSQIVKLTEELGVLHPWQVMDVIRDMILEDIEECGRTYQQIEAEWLGGIEETVTLHPDTAQGILHIIEDYEKHIELMDKETESLESTPEEDYIDYLEEKAAIEGPSEW